MFRVALAIVLLSLPAAAAGKSPHGGEKPAGTSAADKKVWRIDSLIATQRGGIITVEAKGAVQSGGWKNARLKLVKNDGHGVVFEFVAAAPPSDMTVIDAIVPVEATAKVRGRAPSARVAADANEMTTQVLH